MVLWASYVLTSKVFGCRRKLSESIWFSELSCWNVETTLDCLWVKLTLDYLHAKVKSTAGASVIPHITSLWNKQNWIEVWKKNNFSKFFGYNECRSTKTNCYMLSSFLFNFSQKMMFTEYPVARAQRFGPKGSEVLWSCSSSRTGKVPIAS